MQEKIIKCYPSLFSKEILSCKAGGATGLALLLESLHPTKQDSGQDRPLVSLGQLLPKGKVVPWF